MTLSTRALGSSARDDDEDDDDEDEDIDKEEDTENRLRDLLVEYGDEIGLSPGRRAVGTFAEEGVLTQNRGLVLRFKDGREIHLTITTG